MRHPSRPGLDFRRPCICWYRTDRRKQITTDTDTTGADGYWSAAGTITRPNYKKILWFLL